MSDPIAPTRFLPLYRLGLHYCGICSGPMACRYMIDSGHFDCAVKSLKVVCDAIDNVAVAFGGMAEATKTLVAGVMGPR